jgi:hypothetical protein
MIARTGFAVLFLFGVYVVWSLVRDNSARELARDFCQRVHVGDAMSGVAAAAASEGDARHRIIRDDHVSIAHIGALPFSRHLCIVDGMNGKVVAVRNAHLD